MRGHHSICAIMCCTTLVVPPAAVACFIRFSRHRCSHMRTWLRRCQRSQRNWRNRSTLGLECRAWVRDPAVGLAQLTSWRSISRTRRWECRASDPDPAAGPGLDTPPWATASGRPCTQGRRCATVPRGSFRSTTKARVARASRTRLHRRRHPCRWATRMVSRCASLLSYA